MPVKHQPKPLQERTALTVKRKPYGTHAAAPAHRNGHVSVSSCFFLTPAMLSACTGILIRHEKEGKEWYTISVQYKGKQAAQVGTFATREDATKDATRYGLRVQ